MIMGFFSKTKYVAMVCIIVACMLQDILCAECNGNNTPTSSETISPIVNPLLQNEAYVAEQENNNEVEGFNEEAHTFTIFLDSIIQNAFSKNNDINSGFVMDLEVISEEAQESPALEEKKEDHSAQNSPKKASGDLLADVSSIAEK